MKCFKAFFRWLYVEILRLSDETVSEELSKASQQDVEFISEFLNSFSRAADNDSYTYLERVGQYLKNENLAQPVDRQAISSIHLHHLEIFCVATVDSGYSKLGFVTNFVY